jgi:putative effector of murein hydrolase LrgA (UPF0299 family)
LAGAWVYILAAVIGGTTVTLLATGLIFQALLRRADRKTESVVAENSPPGPEGTKS